MTTVSTRQEKDVYLPQPGTVVGKTVLTAAEMLFEIRLDSGQELGHMPGQFVEVTVPGAGRRRSRSPRARTARGSSSWWCGGAGG